MILQEIGFIGLGRMGAHVAQRIINSGREVLVYDSKQRNVDKMVRRGAHGCRSIEEVARKLSTPKVILLCVPSGKTIDAIIRQLILYLSSGDILIDLGNSFYQDSQKRAKELAKQGIHFMDVGMSGGIEGAKNGACLMIGGKKNVASKLKPLFESISKNGSYRYFGKSGAGHLVKGFHNLIEYGYLQSLAEGLESLHQISKKEKMALNSVKICDIWSKGSIVESRLVLDAKKAFQKYPSLKGISGCIYGQTLEEMKKLVKLANNFGVNIYSCKAAIKARLNTQKKPTYSGKIINATRTIFGEHKDWNR